MTKPLLTIMFDIDGVLADFCLGFTTLAHQLFCGYTKIKHTHEAERWDFADCMNKEQCERALRAVKEDKDFFRRLPRVINLTEECKSRIAWLCYTSRVYFVTSRIECGNTIQQTEEWLWKQGLTPYPHVIMTKKKGEAAKLLEADFSIDDKWENAQCVHWISDKPQTKSYLLDYPYNRFDGTGARGVTRVSSLADFLDDVERENRRR